MRPNKTVHFPEGKSISVSRQGSPVSEYSEESTYFSVERRPSVTDTIDDDSDEEDEVTRENTWANRLSCGQETPRLTVTPPPPTMPEAAAGQGSVFGAGLQALGDIGNIGGLVPGAHSGQVDDDPFDQMYRERRRKLLSTLTPDQIRAAHNRAASTSNTPGHLTPEHDTVEHMGDAIPLTTFYDSVNARLEDLEREQNDGPGGVYSEHSPTLREDKQDTAGESLASVTSPETAARLEAQQIAQQLVKSHVLPIKKKDNDGFVMNNQFLNNAAEFNDDTEVTATQEKEPSTPEEQAPPPALEMEIVNDPAAEEQPSRVREGILGSLLRLYGEMEASKSQSTLVSAATTPMFGSPSHSPTHTPSQTPPNMSRNSSGSVKKLKHLRPPSFIRAHSSEDVLGRKQARPKWYDKHHSSHSPSMLAASSLGALASFGDGEHDQHPKEKEKKKKSFSLSAHAKAQAAKKKRKAQLAAEQARITIHIADLLQRQRFILRFGRALMLFGAPSHRLEEYLRVTARTLEIDAQFLYMPGCMLVSFGDAATHTSETKLLRVQQGLNLSKLHATHLIYKELVHGITGLEESGELIDELLRTKNAYPQWLTILFFGLGSGFLSLFAFGGYWYDLPLTFFLGSLVGFLQIWVAPRSDLYSNVFEVSACVLISFLGRAFGSITHNGKNLFCFGAMAQGSLALILPGYIILCGSLELQSKNLVAGAVRMFYAVIYSMFLAFGITMGSAIYGWIDHGATSEITCVTHSFDAKWKILFVPLSALFLSLVNQATWRQLPVMVVIAGAGYTVLYFVQTQVANASSFTSALGALTIGLLGNFYSRMGHGLAFAAMLPGIFIIVPSGVAAQGSLIAGISLADDITNNRSSTTTSYDQSNVTSLGGTMTQVAVGITVGLFVATLIAYPLGTGKKRTGLFTF